MASAGLYGKIEDRQIGYNRTCINGRITGCGKCVGYCQYVGHPGYLTEQLRKEHKCIEKRCFYYLPKPSYGRRTPNNKVSLDALLKMAVQKASHMEGLRVMNVQECGPGRWQFNYITISNAYPVNDLARALADDLNGEVYFKKLDYSFDRCVQLIMAV